MRDGFVKKPNGIGIVCFLIVEIRSRWRATAQPMTDLYVCFHVGK